MLIKFDLFSLVFKNEIRLLYFFLLHYRIDFYRCLNYGLLYCRDFFILYLNFPFELWCRYFCCCSTWLYWFRRYLKLLVFSFTSIFKLRSASVILTLLLLSTLFRLSLSLFVLWFCCFRLKKIIQTLWLLWFFLLDFLLISFLFLILSVVVCPIVILFK